MEFPIIAKTPTGRLFNLIVTNNTTILEIKQMLSDLDGVQIDQERIIFAGKQLEDIYKISYYNIKKGDTIHFVLSLRGGMYHETSGRIGWVVM